MASTNFTNYQPPAIRAEWLNDVNSLTYGIGTSTGTSLIGYLQNGVGALVRSLQGVLRERTSILSFIPESEHAALRDQTSTYNCTSAIIAAMNSLPVRGGRIDIPPGRYPHDEFIVTRPITFVGTGAAVSNNQNTGSVLYKRASATGPGITLSALGAFLENLTIQGAPGNTGDGVLFLEGRCGVSNVAIFGMGRDGLRIGSDTVGPGNVNAWHILNIRAKNNGRHGVFIDDNTGGLEDANAGILLGADLQFNGECGLKLGRSDFNQFSGILTQSNGTYGVHLTANAQSNKFYGGDYEVNGRIGGVSPTFYYDFYVEAGAVKNRLDGLTCYNFPQSFRCDEPENWVTFIDDGLFAGDKQYGGIMMPNYDSLLPTVFDVYDEGNSTTLIPIVKGTTTAGTGTYSLQSGKATTIGNMEEFALQVAITAHTGTGNGLIGGLPKLSSSFGFQPVSVVIDGYTIPANTIIVGMVIPNSTDIALYSMTTTSPTTLTPLALDTAFTARVNGRYFRA